MGFWGPMSFRAPWELTWRKLPFSRLHPGTNSMSCKDSFFGWFYPYHPDPCMVYLPTFGWFLPNQPNVGKHTHTWMVWLKTTLRTAGLVNRKNGKICRLPNKKGEVMEILQKTKEKKATNKINHHPSPPKKKLVSWWFQPIWKICSSNWIISPGVKKNGNHHPKKKMMGMLRL